MVRTMSSHRPISMHSAEGLRHGVHMADVRALFTQHFDAARAALTKGDKPAAAESLHWAIAAARTDPSLRRELASALFHLGHLSRKFGRAGEAEAEQLLSEALVISEGLFGREHAALAPLLNELGRLHVQRGQHTRAEEVLERLLATARVKGEDTADVAVAIAGLAFVKRKLGDDASAEALYRDALRIREKVLEPNHMVTVGTLEQLSETCAARGNLPEALALLRRALLAREATLGPGHATVQAARSRAAELELQIAIAADKAAAAATRAVRGAVATPAWFRRVPDSPADTPSTTVPSPINSKKLEFLGDPAPQVLRPAPLSRERAKTPRVTAAVAAVSLMVSSIQTPFAAQIVISPPESAQPHGTVTGHESDAAQRDAVLANVAHDDVANVDIAHDDVAKGDVSNVDVASGEVALYDQQSTIARVQAEWLGLARKNRTALYASAGVAAVAIMLAGLLMSRPHAGGGSDPVPTAKSTAQRTTTPLAPVVTTAARTGSTATGAAAIAGATHADSFRSASATPAASAPVVQPEKRPADSAPPEFRAPRVDVHVGTVNLPSVPAANVETVARSASEPPRVSDSNRIGTTVGLPVPASVGVDDALIPPKVIGRAPVPRFPDAALHSVKSEGVVVVRFIVDERGSVDVASMVVVQSDNDLFTAAVRDILPRFRFEPARTRPPESKSVAAWVSVPFRFAAKK
jgi:TonB family protein